MDQSVTVANMPPVWTFYVIAIAQLVFGLSTLVLAGVLLFLFKNLLAVTASLQEIMKEVDKKTPSLLSSVDGTLSNVKAISDDARETTSNVTGTVNRVSGVVGTITGKLESPLVKGIGVVTGVAAGLNSMRGNKNETANKAKKKKGLFGRGK